MKPQKPTEAEIANVKSIVGRYGGSYAGSARSSAPDVGNPNLPKVHFDANTNSHFSVVNGKVQMIEEGKRKTPGFVQKIGKIATQTGGMLQDAFAGAGGYIVNTAADVTRQAYRAVRTPYDLGMAVYRSQDATNKSKKLRESLDRVTRAYAAGTVSKADYERQTSEIKRGMQEVNEIFDSAFQSGNAAKQDAIGVAASAVNLLSVGRYRFIQASIAAGPKGIVKSLIPQNPFNKAVVGAGTAVDDALQRIPAFRDLVLRNEKFFVDRAAARVAGETTSQFLGRASKDIAVGLLIKRPVVYQSNIAAAQGIYADLLTGEYDQAVRDAALVASQAVSGGPLGWAIRMGRAGVGKLRQLAVGENSFIDEVSKQIGNGAPSQIGDYIKKLEATDPKQYARVERVFRIAQEVNLRGAGDNPTRAANAVVTHYQQHAIDLAKVTPERLVNDLDRWAQADAIAQKLSPKTGAQYVAVRWDTPAKNALAARVEAAGDDFKAMADAVTEVASQPGVGWGSNPILMARITNAIRSAKSAAEAAQRIRGIATTATIAKDIPPSVAKKLAKLGYSLAAPEGGRKTAKVSYADTRKLVSSVSSGKDDGVFDPTVSPQPQLAALAGVLRRAGVSPESADMVAYDKLSEALVTNLEQVNATRTLGLVGDDQAKGGKFILSRLQQYINDQQPNPYLNVTTLGKNQQSALQDVRQMNLKEMQEALPGISRTDAKKLKDAIAKAYTDVPLEFRGLGVKAADYAYRIPGASVYYRIQGALRYTYNPFFRTQEVIETKVLAHLKANNLVWMKPKAELDRVSQLMDDAKIFTSGYSGEAAQDLTIGRIHANLLKSQKRDLAGLALDIAQKKGVTIEQMVQDYPDELADSLRVVVQYPTRGFLNSPLARTLNIAFFPMRYNLKVTALAAQVLSKQPPTVQTAVIHSIFKASDWLKSPEGIQWQSENADAIQLYSYFIPAQNIASVYHLLTGGPDSLGDLGLLGGLPFGVVSQILDAEGIIHLNTPYVDKATGTVIPEYVPETTKAKAAVALQGFLNSMFTYPGRIIGMPGKTEMIRNQIRNFIDTEGSEFSAQYRMEDLTPLQRKWIDVLSNPDVTQEEIDQLFISPEQTQFQGYTLPPSNLPQPVPVLTRAEVTAQKEAQQGGSEGKKKALPIPEQGQQLQLP